MTLTETLPDSILLVDKSRGVSSFDIIRKIKRAFPGARSGGPIKKIGHAGTLDPIATGLVIVLVNGATRRSSDFLNKDKVYQAGLFIGSSTDSYDATGAVNERIELPPDYFSFPENISRFNDSLLSFLGEIMQEPPMFSAIKKNGSPLYKLARKGVTVERAPRKCLIYSISVSGAPEYDSSAGGFFAQFVVGCSKGTYIRSLCHDIGGKIGVPCHMASLRRISIGEYDVSGALEYGEINAENVLKNIIK